MTAYNFKILPEAEQMATLSADGACIGERETDFNYIKLYQLHSFYVELYFHSHFNVLLNIKIITDTSYLEPYLQGVDVEQLLYN